jgi:acyl carrier protein
MTIEERVKSYFKDIARVKEEDIDMKANIFMDYGLDSIKAIKIISDIEVEYDIDIPDEEAQKIACLNDVVSLIKVKTGMN